MFRWKLLVLCYFFYGVAFAQPMDRAAGAAGDNASVLYIALLAGALLVLLSYYFYMQRRKSGWTLLLQEKTAAAEKERQRAEAALKSLKEAEAQLIQNEKMATLGQMLAGIAHEINNPLNFVRAGSSAMAKLTSELEGVVQQRSAAPDPAVAELLDEMHKLTGSIKTGAERTATIVSALLKISHANRDERTAVNLLENLELALAILQPQVKDRIRIEKHIGVIPPVQANEGEINQVLMNILQNAIHAIAREGVITIRIAATEKEDAVMIEIADSGSGIARENLSKIFDPFFTTKEIGKGTGLGLSIVHSIINKHNGKIDVESEEGKGTRFVIRLPV